MKRLFLFSVMAIAMLFASCSKDDDKQETPSAYITEQQLIGMWKSELDTYDATYYFSSPSRVRLVHDYDYYGQPMHDDQSGSFYLQHADEHLLGILFWEGQAVANGASKANYRKFEWLNSDKTRFSLDGTAFKKQ